MIFKTFKYTSYKYVMVGLVFNLIFALGLLSKNIVDGYITSNIMNILLICMYLINLFIIYSIIFNKDTKLLINSGVSRNKIYLTTIIPVIVLLTITYILHSVYNYIGYSMMYGATIDRSIYEYILPQTMYIFVVVIFYTFFSIMRSNVFSAYSRYGKILITELLFLVVSLVVFAFVEIYFMNQDSTSLINILNSYSIRIVFLVFSFILLIANVIFYNRSRY